MLYQADFNFMLKVVWGGRLVWHAEKNRALGSSNHGSCVGMQSRDASLKKVVVYDHSRLTCTNLITIDNDAKSCYDRILKSLSMAACIAYGLPLLAAVMHNRVQHGMKHVDLSVPSIHDSTGSTPGRSSDAPALVSMTPGFPHIFGSSSGSSEIVDFLSRS